MALSREPARAVVRVHPHVERELAAMSCWPAGRAAAGLLLGSAAADGSLRIAGLVQLWYVPPGGDLHMTVAPQQWQPAVAAGVVGTFLAGDLALFGALPPPAAAGAPAGATGLRAEAADGFIGFFHGEAELAPEPWDGSPPLPVLLGARPPQRPGRKATLRWGLAAGVGLAAVLLTAAWYWQAAAPETAPAPVPVPVAPAARRPLQSAPAAPVPVQPQAEGEAITAPAPAEAPAAAAPVPAPSREPASAPGPAPAQAQAAVHLVQRGETLFAISMRYYGSPAYVDYIRRANRLEGNRILAGQRLTIPPAP